MKTFEEWKRELKSFDEVTLEDAWNAAIAEARKEMAGLAKMDIYGDMRVDEKFSKIFAALTPKEAENEKPE